MWSSTAFIGLRDDSLTPAHGFEYVQKALHVVLGLRSVTSGIRNLGKISLAKAEKIFDCTSRSALHRVLKKEEVKHIVDFISKHLHVPDDFNDPTLEKEVLTLATQLPQPGPPGLLTPAEEFALVEYGITMQATGTPLTDAAFDRCAMAIAAANHAEHAATKRWQANGQPPDEWREAFEQRWCHILYFHDEQEGMHAIRSGKRILTITYHPTAEFTAAMQQVSQSARAVIHRKQGPLTWPTGKKRTRRQAGCDGSRPKSKWSQQRIA